MQIVLIYICTLFHITYVLRLKLWPHTVVVYNTQGHRHEQRLAPQRVKLQSYKSLVRPQVKYASPIWDPWQSYLTHAIESLQNQAARFIHSSYSSTAA